MLIYYKFNNFCSFNCESEFSMSAPGGKVMKRFPDNYVETREGFDLLKSAVIVGENAGGKSNFINSLKYLKSLFVNNAPVKSLSTYINNASKQSELMPVQKFEICFRADNGKVYIYELQINEEEILLEKLQCQKKKKAEPSTIFIINKTDDGNVSEEAKNNLATKRRYLAYAHRTAGFYGGIGLYISKYALLGDEDALAVVEWMTNTLYTEGLNWDRPEDIVKQEEALKVLKDERYLEVFRMVDYSICGLEIDDEKPYSKSVVIRKDEKGNCFKRELQKDSTGVREFFSWAIQIFKVVYENKVVFADEMDRVLNPILSDRVTAFVNGSEHMGQFIFSTHNVLHLDLKIYMKEQIYFVTKDKENLTSEMYSLADFPEVRYETTKIYEFYMKGILGGTAFE